MHLRELISKLPGDWIETTSLNSGNPEILQLHHDSRKVERGTLFFAIQGEKTDGHLFLGQAQARGAVAVVSEREPLADCALPWIRVCSLRRAMGLLAGEFYARPSSRIHLVGITGTNGKTTTAFIVDSVFRLCGPSMLMGTIKTLIDGQELPSLHTTPESIEIQKVLAQAVQQGCRRGVMEVSSHALAFDRTYDCRFPVAVFTNLSQDHLDFHHTLQAYFEAKLKLFDRQYNPGLEWVVTNLDDVYGASLPLPSGTRRLGYGQGPEADLHPLEMNADIGGTSLRLHTPRGELSLKSPLLGKHNVYNLMAAAGACLASGIEPSLVRRGIEALEGVPGRFEKVSTGRPFTVVVDYAHTPEALENVLKLCRQLSPVRVLCLFGCGGDRDRGKRPQMGAVAAHWSDSLVVTSDNPRSEDPQDIIDEIVSGIPAGPTPFETVVDRRAAIARILELARPGDLVLVAGKGHETTQERAGKKTHFDDREVVRELS